MTLKLKPEIKARWLEALRGGKIKQTSGKLRDSTDSMCCLGVLCNLHAEDHPTIAARQKSRTIYLGQGAFPSATVLDWAFGLKRGNKEFRPTTPWVRGVYIPKLDRTLAALNDDGLSFKRIAQIIERHL